MQNKQWKTQPHPITGILKQPLLCALFSVALGLSSTQTRAESLTCYSTVFAPFVIERNGEVKGVDVDVVKEAGRRIGINIDFKLKPWKRLEQEIKIGKVACLAAYFRTKEREAYLDYTHVPLHITAYTLFAHRKALRTFGSLADLKGWDIGVNRGFKTTPDFKQAVEEGWLKRHDVENEQQSIRMIQLNRLQAMLTNYHVGLYNIKHAGATDIEAMLPSIDSTPAYLVFSKKSNKSRLVPLFDEALFNLLKDGTYQTIFDRYLKL